MADFDCSNDPSDDPDPLIASCLIRPECYVSLWMGASGPYVTIDNTITWARLDTAEGWAIFQEAMMNTTVNDTIETCKHDSHAARTAMEALPEWQGGTARHRCPVCAYQAGLEEGFKRAEAAIRRAKLTVGQ